MDSTSFAKEMRAFEGLQSLMVQAQEVSRLFETAGLEVPPPLARMLSPANGKANSERIVPRIIVPAPASPERPAEAKEDWFWVPVRDASATVLLLAILRPRLLPMPSREALSELQKLQPGVNPGSVSNLAARLAGQGEIVRNADGWLIVNADRAGVLYLDNIWGPKDVFGKSELASHRRMLILHLLTLNPGGLQIVQVVEQLSGLDYCHAPVAKDIVKTDMELMQKDSLVKRIGNSKKWVRTGKDE